MVKGHMGDKTPSKIISALETTISTQGAYFLRLLRFIYLFIYFGFHTMKSYGKEVSRDLNTCNMLCNPM